MARTRANPPIITLLTDFGDTDVYVGAVKGAILSVNPKVNLVDLTHKVPPQDIAAAAFLLATAAPSFPPDAVHLAVVDPGVGTARHPLLLVTPGGLFVGPDNGIFTRVLGDALPPPETPIGQPYDAPSPSDARAYELTNDSYWHIPVSSTFHARDIFGPVAAHLTLGVPPEELGLSVDTVKRLAQPAVTRDGDTVTGCVIHVDRFGNLITNIPGAEVGERSAVVSIVGRAIAGITDTYAAGTGLLAVMASQGLLEIALRDGNAAESLGVRVGEPVTVKVGRR